MSNDDYTASNNELFDDCEVCFCCGRLVCSEHMGKCLECGGRYCYECETSYRLDLCPCMYIKYIESTPEGIEFMRHGPLTVK